MQYYSPLMYTPMLLLSISIHASLYNLCIPHYGFMIVTPLSVLIYARWDQPYACKSYVLFVDRLLARLLFMHAVFYYSWLSWTTSNPWPCYVSLWASLYIFWVYVIGRYTWLPGTAWMPWQASIHVVTTLGYHGLIATTQKKNKVVIKHESTDISPEWLQGIPVFCEHEYTFLYLVRTLGKSSV